MITLIPLICSQEAEHEKAKTVGDKEGEAAAENLLVIQLKNASLLKEAFDQYNPIPPRKVWGNDPEYLSITRDLRRALVSESDDGVRKILRGALKTKLNKPKKKKKET